MRIVEVVTLPLPLLVYARVLVFFAILMLVAVALADMQPKRRKVR